MLHDIRLVHARLLEDLDYEGNSISVVARRADVTKQAMGAPAMELERKGYVIRSVDKSDRRIWRMQFTRKGWQLMLETFRPDYFAVFFLDPFGIRLELAHVPVFPSPRAIVKLVAFTCDDW